MAGSTYKLTLRYGDELQRPSATQIGELRGGPRHLVLLVHGYNVSEKEADAAYDVFEQHQRSLLAWPSEIYAPDRRVVRVYWPGNAELGPLSFLFFMHSISHAKQSGEYLADALEQAAASGQLTVDVVAHSLGCRVVLEAIAALQAGTRVRFERLVFFAAAVAIHKIEVDGKQRLALEYCQHVEEGALSLYSGKDIVLSAAFPAGETLTPGHEGIMPTALGHAKWCSPHPLPKLDQRENASADHSDYWGKDGKAGRVQFASREARRFLRFPSAEECSVIGREPPVRFVAADRTTAARSTQPADAYGTT